MEPTVKSYLGQVEQKYRAGLEKAGDEGIRMALEIQSSKIKNENF